MRRAFGFAAALAFAAACSSEGTRAVAPAPDDAGVLAPPPLPRRDAATETDASLLFPDGSKPDAATCPKETKLTIGDLERDPGWKPAQPPSPKCTAGDITQLETNYANKATTGLGGLATGLGSACAACIVTMDTDASWGPIVLNSAGGGFENYGACFGALRGDECGKSVLFVEHCIALACDECAKTEDERAACAAVAVDIGGSCRPFTFSVQASCDQLGTATQRCGSIVEAAKTLCGPNADAGAGDGGS